MKINLGKLASLLAKAVSVATILLPALRDARDVVKPKSGKAE